MFDVEFLLKKPAFDRALIYRYRSGVLIGAVRSQIEDALANEGNKLGTSAPEAFCSALFGSTLFDDYLPFCNWPRSKPKGVRQHAASILDAVGDAGMVRGILVAHADDPIFKLQPWSRAAERCLVIEEPVVSADNVEAVIRYLQSVSDIQPQPPDNAAVVEYFRTLLAREGGEEFNRFAGRFDETMLLHCDAKTGEFAAPPLDAIDTLSRSYIMSPLRRLVQEDRETGPNDLVLGLEVRLRQRALAPRAVFRDLHEISDRLIDEAYLLIKGRGSGDRERTKERVILWSCILLVLNQRSMQSKAGLGETLVARADPILANFDLLAREFLSRANGAQSQNPIGDLWPEMRKLLDVFCRPEPEPTDEEEQDDQDKPEYMKKAEREAKAQISTVQRDPPRKKPKKRKRPDIRVSAQARTIKIMAKALAEPKAFSAWPIWIERLNDYLQSAAARRLELDEGDIA